MTKKFKIELLIFLFSVVFTFFLSYNFDFYWEDVYFQLKNEYFSNNQEILTNFTQTFLSSDSFFTASYDSRPLSVIYWAGNYSLFGMNVTYYRIFKSLILSAIALLLFKLTYKFTNRKIALFSVLVYLTFPEVWKSNLYASDVGVMMHLLTFSAIYLYLINFNQKNNIKLDMILILAMLILVKLSILLKNEARILLPLIVLHTALNKTFIKKNIALIFLLTLITIPFLGIIYGENGIVSPPAFDNLSKLEIMLLFLNRLPLILLSLGYFLCVSILIGFVCLLTSNYKYKKQTIFFAAWLFLGLFMIFSARLLAYTAPQAHNRADLLYIITPLTLLTAISIFCIYKKNLNITVILFIALILSTNSIRLIEWRIGWGDYYLSWQNARDYIDSNYSGAIILLKTDEVFALPAFSGRNNIKLFSGTLEQEESKYLANNIIFASKNDTVPSDHKLLITIPTKDLMLFDIIRHVITYASYKPTKIYLYEKK